MIIDEARNTIKQNMKGSKIGKFFKQNLSLTLYTTMNNVASLVYNTKKSRFDREWETYKRTNLMEKLTEVDEMYKKELSDNKILRESCQKECVEIYEQFRIHKEQYDKLNPPKVCMWMANQAGFY